MSKIARRRLLPPLPDPQSPHPPGPSARYAMFGPPPLIQGEDGAAYDELLARISGAVRPTDTIEEMLVRDIVDLCWMILRLRRMEAALFNNQVRWRLTDVFKAASGKADEAARAEARELFVAWRKGDPAALARAEKLIASRGVGMDEIRAQAFTSQLDHLDRIQGVMADVERRRNSILRELDRHREVIGQAVRRTLSQVEDADYKVVTSKSSGQKDAA